MRPPALPVLAALAVLSAPATAQAPDVPPGIVAALDSANVAFSAAYLRGDGAALAASYDGPAVLHPPAGGIVVGEAKSGFWEGGDPARRFGHRLETTYRRVLAEGLVLEMGRWHSKAGDDAASAEWSSGCYTVIWQRGRDGRWRLTYDGWTAPKPEEWACRVRAE